MEQPSAFKYQQAVEHVRSLISNGLPRGARLPTERELSDALGISRVSVRRAFDELEGSGEVRRVQGSGTFVEGPSVDKGGAIRSFTEETAARGSVAGSTVLSLEVIPATSELSWRLKISPGEPVVQVKRVRTADGIPMCIEADYLRAERVPGLEGRDLSGSLYALLETEYRLRLARVHQTFRATTLDPEAASLLSVAPQSAALEVSHVAWEVDDHDPIYVSSSLYRGDRYSVTLDIGADGTREVLQ